MKMKAALMYGPNDIRVEMIDRPSCPEDGLILKIMAVGLCGSDIRNLTGDSRKGKYPYYVPEDVSFEAASLGEPLTSVFACEENIGIGYPDVMVIVGAGPIGCFMAQLAKVRAGAEHFYGQTRRACGFLRRRAQGLGHSSRHQLYTL